MRTRLFLILVIWCLPSYPQVAEDGRYVLIKGALLGCEGWTDRVLDVEQVESGGRVSLLGINDFPVLGQEREDIEAGLLSAIKERTGRRPQTLAVEILMSRAEYEMVVPAYLTSLNYLLDKKCPTGLEKRRDRKWDLDEKNEMIRNMEIAKKVV